jgi:hypothetical protein
LWLLCVEREPPDLPPPDLEGLAEPLRTDELGEEWIEGLPDRDDGARQLELLGGRDDE